MTITRTRILERYCYGTSQASCRYTCQRAHRRQYSPALAPLTIPHIMTRHTTQLPPLAFLTIVSSNGSPNSVHTIASARARSMHHNLFHPLSSTLIPSHLISSHPDNPLKSLDKAKKTLTVPQLLNELRVHQIVRPVAPRRPHPLVPRT